MMYPHKKPPAEKPFASPFILPLSMFCLCKQSIIINTTSALDMSAAKLNMSVLNLKLYNAEPITLIKTTVRVGRN